MEATAHVKDIPQIMDNISPVDSEDANLLLSSPDYPSPDLGTKSSGFPSSESSDIAMLTPLLVCKTAVSGTQQSFSVFDEQGTPNTPSVQTNTPIQSLAFEPFHTLLNLEVPQDFNLEKAVISYGFQMAAPNRWQFPLGHESGWLERPLRLRDGRAVWVRIGPMTPQENNVLPVRVGVGELPEADADRIKAQVRRMLRLSPEDSATVAGFQAVHAAAKAAGFGRLFRSPTLWEDMVKTQLLCHCGWGRTLSMNRALCQLQAELSGPPLGCSANLSSLGDFPNPNELQNLAPETLAKKCGLGYRASWLVKLAQGVATGEYDLGKLEGPGRLGTAPERFAAISRMHGFGPFSAANVMQCLGEYEKVAADSETARHLRAVHGKVNCDLTNVETVVATVYEQYAPYQFLAYWFEIWHEYEARFGPLNRMSPDSYHLITGHNMSRTGDEMPAKKRKEMAPEKASSAKRVATVVDTVLKTEGANVASESFVSETLAIVKDTIAPVTPEPAKRRSTRRRGLKV